MAVKNYYVVLGVPRTETLSGIRTAYRDLAKRFHPDLVGDAGTRTFQEIVEAYDVLSDPERRREHDRDLDAAHRASVPVRVRVDAPSYSEPWPLRSQAEPLTRRHAHVEPLEDFRRRRPRVEDFRRRRPRARDPYDDLFHTLFWILR